MLMGEYTLSIDSKGRLVIPSKFREILGDNVILTRGLDNSLFLYKEEEFNLLTKKLLNLPFTDKESRDFLRFFLSGANTLECDKQGRIIVPNYLREYASLNNKVVLVGVLNKVEIWSLENWNDFMNNNFKRLSNISSNLFNSN